MKPIRATLALLPFVCLAAALFLYAGEIAEERQAYRAGPDGVDVSYGYGASAQPLLPDEVLARPFRPVAAPGEPAPVEAVHQWYRVTLRNSSDHPAALVLVVDNPLADRLTLHRLHPTGGLHLLRELGENAPGLTRAERALPHYVFTLDAAAEATLLVHYAGDGTSLFPLAVLSADQFADLQQLRHGSHAAFAGILLLVACYSSLLGLWLRDPAYLAYSSYGLLVLLSFGVTTGFVHYALPPAVAGFLSREVIFVNGLTLIGALQFALFFLRFDRDNRRVYRRAQGYTLVVFLCALASIPAPEGITGKLFTAVHLVSYGWVFVLLSFRFRERFRWTRYYLLSWVPFFTSTALVSAMFAGLIAYDVALRFAPLAAVVFEIVFMAAALGERFRMLEQRRLHAATHDELLGLPAAGLVEQRLGEYLERMPAGSVHVLAVEVSNYAAVAPYLAPAQLRAVILGLAEQLQRDLALRVDLLPLEQGPATATCVGLPQREILTLLLRDPGGQNATAALEALQGKDNFNPMPEQVPYRIECRFGLALQRRGDGSAGDLLGASRIALARAAELGKSWWVFDEDDLTRGQRKMRLAQDLDLALRQEALELYHQPQLDLARAGGACSEVLLRWRHPTLDFIDPEELVTIAEQTGLIRRLTRWVIGESMRHCAQLQAAGHADCRVALNLSAHDFAGDGLLDALREGLEAHGLAAGQFTLEMTESVRLAVSARTEEIITQLRDLGFTIAIDDFGTGYAAMSYALNHQVDELKIDRGFLDGYPDNPRVETVVASVIGMARALGITVTAEGVESPAQAQALAALGCEQLQGYGYARPMPLEDYLAWLTADAAGASEALLHYRR